jgi:hypothetical protein
MARWNTYVLANYTHSDVIISPQGLTFVLLYNSTIYDATYNWANGSFQNFTSLSISNESSAKVVHDPGQELPFSRYTYYVTCFNHEAPCAANWSGTLEYSTKVTITKRISSTVCGRSNLTILDVLDLSDPSPTNYTAETFFEIFESEAFNWGNQTHFFDTGDESTINSTALNIFLDVILAIDNSDDYDFTAGFLRQFLAVPVLVYNLYVYFG